MPFWRPSSTFAAALPGSASRPWPAPSSRRRRGPGRRSPARPSRRGRCGCPPPAARRWCRGAGRSRPPSWPRAAPCPPPRPPGGGRRRGRRGRASRSCSTSSSAPSRTAAAAASARVARCSRRRRRRKCSGRRTRAPVPGGEHVLHAGHALADGDAAHLRQGERRGARAHPAQDQGHAQLAALRRLGLDALDRGPAAEDDAGREVLDLALAVDGRVGDDRDRLLEVVRERHRHRRERPSGPSQPREPIGSAPRSAWNWSCCLSLSIQPAEASKVSSSSSGSRTCVLVAVLLHRDRLEAARQAGARLGGGQGAAALGAAVDLALHVGVVEHDRDAVLAGQEGDLLARRQRGGVARELGDRDDARLGGDEVELVGLDPPRAGAGPWRPPRRPSRRRLARPARPAPGRTGPAPRGSGRRGPGASPAGGGPRRGSAAGRTRPPPAARGPSRRSGPRAGG